MYLGIDLGTSGVKVVIIDEAQRVVAQASSALTVSHPQPLWSEQNPQDWWQALQAAIYQLRQTKPSALKAIKAIGLAGQQHGATLLDKNDQVLRPAILWNDGRSFPQCQQIEAKVKNYAEITGNRVMPGFTAPKLLWVAENEAEIFARIKKVLLPKDYLRLLLSGDFASDMSDAAGTSWLDVGKRKWSNSMLAATKLSTAHMPKLYEGNEITGVIKKSLAHEWGIADDAVIIAGAGDNAAGAISMNVIKPGVAFLSLGTSGVYFVSSDEFKANPAGGVHTFCHCLPKLWQQMTVHLSAASSLQWLATMLNKSMQELLIAAEHSPESHDQLVFLPYLSGERTPHNNPYARGVFFGLSHATKSADLTRAVLEGVAFAFADGQNAMLAAGIPIDEVSVVGGGARSLYWGKILASILNRPLIYRSEREVGAALGVARLAWLAFNQKNPTDAFPVPTVETIVNPDARLAEQLTKKYELFKKLYQQLQCMFVDLAK